MSLLFQQELSIACLVPNCRDGARKKTLLNHGLSEGLIKEQYMENECKAAKA